MLDTSLWHHMWHHVTSCGRCHRWCHLHIPDRPDPFERLFFEVNRLFVILAELMHCHQISKGKQKHSWVWWQWINSGRTNNAPLQCKCSHCHFSCWFLLVCRNCWYSWLHQNQWKHWMWQKDYHHQQRCLIILPWLAQWQTMHLCFSAIMQQVLPLSCQLLPAGV